MKNRRRVYFNSFRKYLRLLASLILIVLCLASLFISYQTLEKDQSIITNQYNQQLDFSKSYNQAVSFGARKYNHSPSIVSLGDDRLMAVWYAGDREGGNRMELRANYFDGEKWGKEKKLIDSSNIPNYVRRIGNAIIFFHPNNPQKIYIIFTTTVAGWGASHLNIMSSNDKGKTWSVPKRIYLGNILNFSHLVKCKPFFYKNGNIGIPAYHEFINKFGVIINIQPDGKVLDYYKLSKFRDAIQPCVNFRNDRSGIAFMRNSSTNKLGQKIVINKFDKEFNGKTEVIDIVNNDNALATVNYNDGILMTYNDSVDDTNLKISFLDWENLNVKNLLTLYEQKAEYPYMIYTKNGLHIVYSVEQGRFIKHDWIKNF